jgi:hypothetical protein
MTGASQCQCIFTLRRAMLESKGPSNSGLRGGCCWWPKLCDVTADSGCKVRLLRTAKAHTPLAQRGVSSLCSLGKCGIGVNILRRHMPRRREMSINCLLKYTA